MRVHAWMTKKTPMLTSKKTVRGIVTKGGHLVQVGPRSWAVQSRGACQIRVSYAVAKAMNFGKES